MKRTPAEDKSRPSLPTGWHVAMLLLGLVGSAFPLLPPTALGSLERLPTDVLPGRWSTLIGIFILSIPITHYIVFWSVRWVTSLLELTSEETVPDLWAPTLVGFVESLMYPVALLVGQAQFIGLWLAIKVAGQWIGWSGEKTTSTDAAERDTRAKGRRRFNRVLVGSALRVCLAAATYAVITAYAIY